VCVRPPVGFRLLHDPFFRHLPVLTLRNGEPLFSSFKSFPVLCFFFFSRNGPDCRSVVPSLDCATSIVPSPSPPALAKPIVPLGAAYALCRPLLDPQAIPPYAPFFFSFSGTPRVPSFPLSCPFFFSDDNMKGSVCIGPPVRHFPYRAFFL